MQMKYLQMLRSTGWQVLMWNVLCVEAELGPHPLNSRHMGSTHIPMIRMLVFASRTIDVDQIFREVDEGTCPSL